VAAALAVGWAMALLCGPAAAEYAPSAAAASRGALESLQDFSTQIARALDGPISTQIGSSLDTTQLVAIAAALGWASGLRLYAVLFLTGLAGALSWVALPPGLQLLQHPVLLSASGLMLGVEFFADKIPGIDSLWDVLHTLIRIPAGAALAAGVFGGDQAVWTTAAALMGGTLAATSHLAKSSARAAVNTSPEPFSNVALSLAGDAAVPATLWLSWNYPAATLIVVGTAVVVMLVSIVLFWQFARRLWRRVSQGVRPQEQPA
jgi:hypothetical protein